MKKKILNILVLITFFLTIMVPLTGIIVHKMASLAFLLLCVIHTWVYRKELRAKKYMILGMVFVAFVTGILGMIMEHIPFILAMHKAISVLCVFFLAIHIFVNYKKLKYVKKQVSL